MLLYYIMTAVACALLVTLCKRRDLVVGLSMLFFVAQAAFAIYITQNLGDRVWGFFRFDMLGVVYFCLMSFVGILSGWRSIRYLDSESLRHLKIYFVSLIALCLSLWGVYFSSNVAVTWIFLEATTLATAGLTYHRRTPRALEATWKYIFVSSVGIAIAYLGVLLLSAASPHTLSYEGLEAAVAHSSTNGLYLRIAFLFLLVGYSTKLEIFPLFTVGIDANHSAPSPASAFISSALVGGGFVAILRIYHIAMASTEAQWMQSVLMLVGILSLISAGVYMGRTGNYKRMLAYSTVENGGIAMLGLAIGGVGVFAAVLHSMAHTLIKAVLYLQMSIAGRMYGTYKVGRLGGYFKADAVGATVLALSTVALVAAPPSLLFRSEYLIFSSILVSSKWWLIIPIGLPLLACTYWGLLKLCSILFATSVNKQHVDTSLKDRTFSMVLVGVLLLIFVAGVYQSQALMNIISTIAR